MVVASLIGLLALLSCSSRTGDQGGNQDQGRAASTAAPRPVKPLPLTLGQLLKGNVSPRVPTGPTGKLSVVEIGPVDRSTSFGGTMPIVVRNNTTKAVSHIDITATARKSGRLVATGSSQHVAPAQLVPGQAGLAFIYFEHPRAVPSGARFAFRFETMPADKSSYNTATLKVIEANRSSGAIVGTGKNTTGAKLQGPYAVSLFCFAHGQVTRTDGTYADQDNDLPPDGTVTFSLDLYGHSCPKFLVGITSYYA